MARTVAVQPLPNALIIMDSKRPTITQPWRLYFQSITDALSAIVFDASGNPTNFASLPIAQSDVINLVGDLSLKAPLASPHFTGIPTAPTAPPATASTQLATTAYVDAAVAAGGGGGGGGTGDVIGPASATDNAIALFNGVTGKVIKDSTVLLSSLAPLLSPAFTGIPTAPTAPPGTNTTQLATTAYVTAAITAGTATPALHHATHEVGGSDAITGAVSLTTLTASGPVTAAMLDLPEGVPGNPPADRARIYSLDVNGYTQVEMKDSAGHGVRFSSDNVIIAKITEPTGIARGQGVYIAGASGANAEVRLAKSDNIATMPVIGIVLDAGALNAFTRILSVGTLQGVDTSAFVEGVSLFVSPSTAGGFTDVLPISPNFAQRVGFVTRSHATQGEILVATTGTVTDPRLHHATHEPGGIDALTLTAASRLFGRGASSAGAVQEISLGSNLSMTGTTLSAAGSGDVVGPGSATDSAVAVFDGTTGKLLKNSTWIIASPLRPVTDNAHDLGSVSQRVRDGYFAGTMTAGQVQSNHIDPQFVLNETDAPTNAKRWAMTSSSQSWVLVTQDDAGTNAIPQIAADRSGNVTMYGSLSVAGVNITSELFLKAPLASPAFTGTPTAPTPPALNSSTRLATTAFVTSAISASGGGNVVGPASATADALAVYSGTTGKLLKDSTVRFVGLDLISTGAYYAADSGAYMCFNRAGIASPADGQLLLTNWAFSGFTRLHFGGTTAAFPALRRSASALNARLADDSGDAVFTAATATAGTSTTQVATTAFVQGAITGGGLGNVVGPASATADAIALFNGTTGKIIKDSAVLLTTLARLNLDNVFTATQEYRAISPKLYFTGINANPNEGKWKFETLGNPFTLQAVSDALVTQTTPISADRSGNVTVGGTLQFEGTDGSFPALKRSGTTLAVRLANNSADTALTAATAAPGTNTTQVATTAFVQTATAPAVWVAEPYNAANFVGVSPMTWTVDAGDQTRLSYLLIGKTMTVSFYIQGTTLSGTAGNAVRMTIPAGKTIAGTALDTMVIVNAGAFVGKIVASAGVNYLQFMRVDNTNFTLETNAAIFTATFTFEVN